MSQDSKKAALVTQLARAEPEEKLRPGWPQPLLHVQTLLGPGSLRSLTPHLAHCICSRGKLDSGGLQLILIQHDNVQGSFPAHSIPTGPGLGLYADITLEQDGR